MQLLAPKLLAGTSGARGASWQALGSVGQSHPLTALLPACLTLLSQPAPSSSSSPFLAQVSWIPPLGMGANTAFLVDFPAHMEAFLLEHIQRV